MKPLALILGIAAFPALAAHELDGRDLAEGQNLYAQHCASCHGAALQGQEDWQTPGDDGVYPAPPHDETGHTWHHSNKDLFEYTQLGGQAIAERLGLKSFASGMPGFGETLSDEEIWEILAFIQSRWPARQQELQHSRNAPHD